MCNISVIIPIYNSQKYLSDCIDSVLNQTVFDYEIILIDDGSTDNSNKICLDYAKRYKNIKVFHQPNKGVSAARNLGIEVSSGKYIAYIDSDDIVHKDYLKILYEGICKFGAQISCCRKSEFLEDISFGKLVGNEYIITGREAVRKIYTFPSEIEVFVWGKLFLKELFNGISFPEGRIHEDQACVPIIMYKATKIFVSEKTLYGYRLTDGSIMHQKFYIQRYDDIIALEECSSYFSKNEEKEIVLLIDCRKKEYLSIYSLLARKNNIYSDVPHKYKMSQFDAISYMYKNLSYSKFSYHMMKVYPKLVRPIEYIRKIMRMIGVKVHE